MTKLNRGDYDVNAIDGSIMLRKHFTKKKLCHKHG